MSGLTLALAAFLGLVIARVVVEWRRRRGLPRCGFAVYLLVVGTTSTFVYGGLSCGRISPDTLRYDLLGLFSVVGVMALFFTLERQRAWRAAATLALVAWAGVSAYSHGRLLAEYALTPPPNDAREAAERLLADGVRRARANYWIAYRMTFLTGERLVVASNGPVRVAEYQDIAGNAPIGIREARCDEGRHLAGPFYGCPLGPDHGASSANR